ncbi:MarR family transcriptional regulator [bacterium]|nr:MarR family transcriptional regulator [bacterium]
MNKSELQKKSDKLREYHNKIKGFYNDYAKSIGITIATLEVLNIIINVKNCTQRIITQKTYFPKQTVNAIIKTLSSQNLIEPLTESGSDKRSKIIKLTQEGIIFAKNSMKKINEVEYYALEKLGSKKCEALLSIMQEYLNNINMIRIENRG